MRVSAEWGADLSVSTRASGGGVTISRDGTLVAFVAEIDGGKRSRLFVRRLEELTATGLPGTEGASGPFFSPDGQFIGFAADGALKKVAVAGGPR